MENSNKIDEIITILNKIEKNVLKLENKVLSLENKLDRLAYRNTPTPDFPPFNPHKPFNPNPHFYN